MITHHHGFAFFPAYRSYYPVRSYRYYPDYCDPLSPDYDPDYCYYLRYGVYPGSAARGYSSYAPGLNADPVRRTALLAVDERRDAGGRALQTHASTAHTHGVAAEPDSVADVERADPAPVREGIAAELPLVSATEAPEALPIERHGGK